MAVIAETAIERNQMVEAVQRDFVTATPLRFLGGLPDKGGADAATAELRMNRHVFDVAGMTPPWMNFLSRINEAVPTTRSPCRLYARRLPKVVVKPWTCLSPTYRSSRYTAQRPRRWQDKLNHRSRHESSNETQEIRIQSKQSRSRAKAAKVPQIRPRTAAPASSQSEVCEGPSAIAHGLTKLWFSSSTELPNSRDMAV
jgi:hypothetical protein